MKLDRKALRMTEGELTEFLEANRWGRLATANAEAEPHITPLGYVWFEGAVYFNALHKGRRARDIAANPKVAFLVDAGVGPGERYNERRGAIVYGDCVLAEGDPRLAEAQRRFAVAFEVSGVEEVERRTHSWYRIDVSRVSSWDFGKIPAGADRTLDREAKRDAGR